jgi:glycosyltransferase involved in cell wall biosynthesis
LLLLTRYGPCGASSRLRAYQYLPYLRSRGLDITTLPLFGDYYQEDLYAGRPRRWGRIAAAYLMRLLRLAVARTFDLFWIEYELFPWLPALPERLLARNGTPYVVDYDDAIYHRYDLHRNAFVRRVLGGKIDAIMRGARAVIVGNAYLGERAHAAGARRVEQLPTAVDLARYPASPHPVRNGLTVGWIGSPSTAGYLSLIKPPLADIARQGTTRVVVVGARQVDLDGIPVEVKPWSEATEVEELQSFDVGIMPLPDAPWERGKCGYKLIQYMACGLPVVASPVGVNRTIVEPGVNGFLAGNDDEWRSALTTLGSSADLRHKLGRAGRAKVEAAFSTRVTAPRLAAILESA